MSRSVTTKDWMSPRMKLYLMVFLLVGCAIPAIQGQRAAASLGTKVKKFRRSNRGDKTKTSSSDEYFVQGENNATIVATMKAIFVRPLKELFHLQSSSSSTEGDKERQSSNPSSTEGVAIVVALLVGLVTILFSFWKYYTSNRKEDGEFYVFGLLLPRTELETCTQN